MATIGSFDGVHSGHRYLLAQLCAMAAERGLVATAVTFGSHPRGVTSGAAAPSMLQDFADRIDAIQAAGVEDVIVIEFDERLRHTSAEDFMRRLHDDYGVEALLMGFDNRFGHDGPRGAELYREMGRRAGVEVVVAGELPEMAVSSSAIRSALDQGHVAAAAVMLGRPYALKGRVVHGKALGRRLGFPTANVAPSDSGRLIPAPGVYAARVNIDGRSVNAVVNIGRRPTVDGAVADAPLSIEAHLLDFSGDIYGREVEVEFVDRLRGEKRFGSLEELAAAIAEDCRRASRLLQD